MLAQDYPQVILELVPLLLHPPETLQCLLQLVAQQSGRLLQRLLLQLQLLNLSLGSGGC